MQIEITKKFGKQVEKCQNKKIRTALSKIIQNIHQARNLHEIRNLKKLKGFKKFYRIRIGDYRMGIVIKNNKVVLAAFDHRSDIYNYFP
jgi:mRNA-degrading endonuclease RelE of RelBE toxin-antitoxin system